MRKGSFGLSVCRLNGMRRTYRVGRNDPCPCGTGAKYKKCCLGKIPWPELIAQDDPRIPRLLTTRGKNLWFLGALISILGLDKLKGREEWREVKGAVTAERVSEIHQAVQMLWPDAQGPARTA